MKDRNRISELRFRFGTRDLKPKTQWTCDAEGCLAQCDHEGARETLEADDGEHITLVLEHGVEH